MEMKIGKVSLAEKTMEQSYQHNLEFSTDKSVEKPEAKNDKEVNLQDSLEIADNLAKAFNKGIKFQVHQETEELYVEIVDRETGDVIKQIPPEEMLKIAANIQEFLGLIVDKKA